jgi:hypothetical protein
MALAWQLRVGAQSGTGGGECLATPAWNGADLFVGGNSATINGITYPGSVQEVDPATGVPIWATGLTGEDIGSPSLDGAGILAVPIFNSGTGGVELVSSSTGAVLAQLGSGLDFAQAPFANNRIFTATGDGVGEWGVKPSA